MPSISQDEKNFLGMAGEFLVAAELNRRYLLSAATYGTAKSADVWAFNEDTHRAVRIEVKTTSIENRRWAVGMKALQREGWNPDVFFGFLYSCRHRTQPRHKPMMSGAGNIRPVSLFFPPRKYPHLYAADMIFTEPNI